MERLTSISSSFLVPDPDTPGKSPFVLDQMWVVNVNNTGIRLLAI
jgi:hypothetical protein